MNLGCNFEPILILVLISMNAQLEAILFGCLLYFLDLVIIEYAKRQVNICGEVIIPDVFKQLISDFRDILINLALILLG